MIFNFLKNTLFLIVTSLIFSCNQKDLDYVKYNTWQYDSGFKIGDGDFVQFESPEIFKLSQDTIYFKGRPKALVKSTSKKKNEMKITSVDTKRSGVYINIKEFTH